MAQDRIRWESRGGTTIAHKGGGRGAQSTRIGSIFMKAGQWWIEPIGLEATPTRSRNREEAKSELIRVTAIL